ncbi:MAG: DUF167 domain-containing protein [Armatimonadetes bacterium]|nr:DUF167 domain-containing protein [Armatimonadota bacterium]
MDPTTAELRVRVTTRASRPRIADDGADSVQVWVAAPPVDGEANKAVEETVAKSIGLPKSRVRVVRGHKSRDKVLALDGCSAADLVVWRRRMQEQDS